MSCCKTSHLRKQKLKNNKGKRIFQVLVCSLVEKHNKQTKESYVPCPLKGKNVLALLWESFEK